MCWEIYIAFVLKFIVYAGSSLWLWRVVPSKTLTPWSRSSAEYRGETGKKTSHCCPKLLSLWIQIRFLAININGKSTISSGPKPRWRCEARTCGQCCCQGVHGFGHLCSGQVRSTSVSFLTIILLCTTTMSSFLGVGRRTCSMSMGPRDVLLLEGFRQ